MNYAFGEEFGPELIDNNENQPSSCLISRILNNLSVSQENMMGILLNFFKQQKSIFF